MNKNDILAAVFTLEGFYGNPYVSVYPKTNELTYNYSLKTVYLTPFNYDGHPFVHGSNNNFNDNANINIGRLLQGDRYVNMAFYSAYLFDRSLDEQEIKAFIRKYIDAD